jgi:hypothetical protein
MKSMRFGNYAKLTLDHEFDPRFLPGQCVRINGKWFAVASTTQDELEIVVPHDSPMLVDDELALEFPLGPGFSLLEAPEVHCVAAGTGIGTMISVVNYRLEKNLHTTVQLYARNVSKDDVIAVFPVLKEVDFGCWNTCHWGRPTMKEVLATPPEQPVFFAGPKSLMDDMKAYSDKHKIVLNY